MADIDKIVPVKDKRIKMNSQIGFIVKLQKN